MQGRSILRLARVLLLASAAMVALSVSGCIQTAPPAEPQSDAVLDGLQQARWEEGLERQLIPATVTKVTDGDIVRVLMPDGSQERVRLIGIDSPEVHRDPPAPYSREARSYVRSMLETGTPVWLELDVEQRDKHDRLLAYVWTERPRSRSDAEMRDKMLNADVALAGFAKQMTVAPNVRYADLFRAYVSEARRADRGLWAK